MYRPRMVGGILLILAIAVILILWQLPQYLVPVPPTEAEKKRDAEWVATSPSWADRQFCRWMGLCGVNHLRWDDPVRPRDEAWTASTAEESYESRILELRSLDDMSPLERTLTSTSYDVSSGEDGEQGLLIDIPDYVLQHAPLVHLSSKEAFWPSDIQEHIKHMIPTLNHQAINLSSTLTLDNLGALNAQNGTVYLTSEVDVEARPAWLHNHAGKPNPPTSPPSPNPGEGYSSAPAILILVPKANATLDVFWFFFYSYNLGQTVLNTRYGNHVGDWEHCMIRFQQHKPQAMFLSEHEGGQAYLWDALEKAPLYEPELGNPREGPRPVVYSAVGSHAMYAFPGAHAYVLPFQMLKDETDKGPLWDPALNFMAYIYRHDTATTAATAAADDTAGGAVDDQDEAGTRKHKKRTLYPALSNPAAPTSWFDYRFPWGDELLTLDDVRQWRIFQQYHYVTGPRGPKFKNLERKQVCEHVRKGKTCRLFESIEEGRHGSWHS